MAEHELIWADTETGSTVDLKSAGTYRYAEDPSTHIQLFSYALNDGEVKIWDPHSGEEVPDDLCEYFDNPKYVFVFFNALFDRAIIDNCLGIKMPISRYRCMMAFALSHSLPGSLEKWEEVMGVKAEFQKLKEGKRLVQKFCKPRKQKKGALVWATPETDPEDWATYKEYCRIDTAGMRDAAKRMPKFNYPLETELQYWFMDQEINDYGMLVDLDLVNAAVEHVEVAQKQLAKRTQEMTATKTNPKGEVQAATQRDAMLAFIAKIHGIELPDMQKANLERLIEDPDLPPDLKELIVVRLSSCTTSTAKYKKLLKAVSRNGRLKGCMQYCGASRTGRSGGKIYNPLNLAKPKLKHEEILIGIDALKTGEAVAKGYDIMKLTSSAIRYAIVAPKGKKFIVADMKAIEARVTPYIANEHWKIQFFRDYDAGLIKFDNYVAAYAKSFNIDPSLVTKDQRQIGKIQELALGFGGAGGSIVSFANMYHIDIPELAEKIKISCSEKVLKEADQFYDWMDGQDINDAKEKARKIKIEKEGVVYDETGWEEYYTPSRTYGLDKDAFVPLDSAKRLWREGHPATKDCWKDADNAMRMAIQIPNTKFWFGKCYMIRKKNWVRTVLPSGRSICYPGAKINKKGDIVFMGTHQITRQWCEIRTAGAKIFQNSVQALARDFLKYWQKLAWDNGYRSILEVYDELVCEVPDTDEYNLETLLQFARTNPPWALDIPLNADGFEDYRYHKSLD